MAMDKLTEEEVNNIHYGLSDRDNIFQYGDRATIEAKLRVHHPEVIEAHEKIIIYQRLLKIAVENLKGEEND